MLNYEFRTWHNFLNCAADDGKAMEKLLQDSKTVFSARNGRPGQSYSAGETYFLPAAMTPRCGLERLARAVFNLHAGALIPGEDYDANLSGAEWWTLVLDGQDDVGFHWDRDYALEDDGLHVHPIGLREHLKGAAHDGREAIPRRHGAPRLPFNRHSAPSPGRGP